jgi:hypothetical protein
MLGTILTLGSTGDLTAYVGTLFSDTWAIIALAVGVPLAFYVIRRVIGLAPKGGGAGRRGRE